MKSGHDHDHCIADALDRAERLCVRRGARLTPQRRRVLEEVWGGHEAVKAYEIIRRMSTGDEKVKPPTVYRALDFLLEQGFVHRIESINGYIGCPHPEESHAVQLLVCTTCGNVEEIEAPEVIATLEKEAGGRGFTVERQVIELRGLCRRCRG